MSFGRQARTRLGPRFNEGARLLWGVLIERRWSINKAAKELDVTTGMLSGWLFGDRRPELQSANKIASKVGLATHLWDLEPTEPFDVPVLSSAKLAPAAAEAAA